MQVNPSWNLLLFLLARLTCSPLPMPPDPSQNKYVGAEKCAGCHPDVSFIQKASEHARTLRSAKAVPELQAALPLRFSDQTNEIQYRLEQSSAGGLDLVATQDQRTERFHLLWAFGAGRKGITFVGRTDAGEYGQSRLSWYQKIKQLDLTTGTKKNARDPHEALADWLPPVRLQECFGCHVTLPEQFLPEATVETLAGIQCERCHGPGQEHIEAVTEGGRSDLAIENPGKLAAREQIRFCGGCHHQPPADFSQVLQDKKTIRFAPPRLVLSRCYDESKGQLKCTTCHNTHENLATSAEYYDQKCRSCHTAEAGRGSPCPVAKKDCVSCHMPREPLMKHSDFADHWIRVLPRTSHKSGRP
ncbi:MAG: hypothetical protein DMG05_14275 [Acidobacteria bacterium]|nr:MAG: hypothetical protein DMG05_14275 [Acidobacteriota bacterium]